MKLPFTLSLKFVFRILLPGFLLTLAFFPLLSAGLGVIGVPAGVDIFLTATVVIGWLFVVLDMPIYMALEGRRYWPEWLRKHFVQLEGDRLERLRADIRSRRRYLEASVELRRFPIAADTEEYRAMYPTRLGNLLTAYEAYPDRVYGMDSVFYWPRLWVTLDKDLREELDGQQAIADSATYVTVALWVGGISVLVYGLLQAFELATLPYVPSPGIAMLLGAMSLVAGSALYRLSLHAHAQFGELFKAVFDTYRTNVTIDDVVKDVAELLGDPAVTALPARERYDVAWRYLHNYRVKTPAGKVVKPRDLPRHAAVSPGSPPPAPASGPADPARHTGSGDSR